MLFFLGGLAIGVGAPIALGVAIPADEVFPAETIEPLRRVIDGRHHEQVAQPDASRIREDNAGQQHDNQTTRDDQVRGPAMEGLSDRDQETTQETTEEDHRELEPGSIVVVAEDSVELRVENEVIGQLAKGAKLEVLQARGDWVGVDTELDGKKRTGWVRKWAVELRWQEDRELKRGDMAVVVKDGAELKLGSDVVSELARGTKVRVTEANGYWIGVSVEIEGTETTGWVRKSKVKRLGNSDAQFSP